MKIPQTLKIGGHEVKVKTVKQIEAGDRTAQVRTSQNIIWVADTYRDEGKKIVIPESMRAEGLLHEIIHYVLLQNGYGVLEKMTTSLASGMFQVLRDNNLDFRRGAK